MGGPWLTGVCRTPLLGDATLGLGRLLPRAPVRHMGQCWLADWTSQLQVQDHMCSVTTPPQLGWRTGQWHGQQKAQAVAGGASSENFREKCSCRTGHSGLLTQVSATLEQV